ncbi:MAG: N-acetylmuramoyl-L-alanine amidase, partial [Methylobacteriaceae bacterium]|nr:N-acetylmuramoyl-L-alanine amidase [Methylobacteriaceae bacterium]
NAADRAAGAEAVETSGDVADILFDLTRRETRAFAHLYSRTLVGYLGKATKLNKNPSRSAGFKVLKAPDVPSILLELGYLSSEKDAQAMASPEWRERATRAVAQSIEAFLADPARAAEATPAVATSEAAAGVAEAPRPR